jgi:hypothetical protein
LKSRIPFLFGTIFVPFLACVGCDTTKNIANDPKYPTDYKINQLYALKKPVFVERPSGELFWVQKPGNTGGVPSSPEAYKAADKKNWPNVIGILEPGTKLKVIRIQLEKNFEMGNTTSIAAQIIDGDFAKKTVELLFISKKFYQRRPSASITMIDPDYLEAIGVPPN